MKISGSFVDLKQEKDSALFSLLVIDEGDNKDRDCATFIYNCHHWLYLKGVAIMKNPVVKSQAKCFCHCHEGFFYHVELDVLLQPEGSPPTGHGRDCRFKQTLHVRRRLKES